MTWGFDDRAQKDVPAAAPCGAQARRKALSDFASVPISREIPSAPVPTEYGQTPSDL
jgi:hypothetical protein